MRRDNSSAALWSRTRRLLSTLSILPSKYPPLRSTPESEPGTYTATNNPAPLSHLALPQVDKIFRFQPRSFIFMTGRHNPEPAVED